MQLNKYIEHTLLKQTATKQDLENLVDEAIKFKFFGVCVNSANVSFVKEKLKNTNIKLISVVGFPLGACTTKTKSFEAKEAIENGADEIDMVMNLNWFKSQLYDLVQKDIEEVKKACGEKILKVILETDFLNKKEIEKACEICAKANANFVKTSTGFVKNSIGAVAKNIEIMKKALEGSALQVKASGGIKTKEQALQLLKSGASRLGTSSSVEICQYNN